MEEPTVKYENLLNTSEDVKLVRQSQKREVRIEFIERLTHPFGYRRKTYKIEEITDKLENK